MPALKMKTKPSTGCLREGENLHQCHKQNKISKSSHFLKLYQHASTPDGWTPRSRNAFEEQIKSDEAVDLRDCCREESVEDLDTPKSADAAPSDPQLAALPSILETIFSPVLEDGEVQDKHANDRDADVDEQGDLPHLDTEESDDGSCSSHEDKPCNVSDHLISDLSASAFSFDGSVGFSDLIYSASPDYDHINSQLIFDMDEECLMLPMSERDIESNHIHDDSSDAPVLNMDDPFMYLAIHQLKSSEQDTEIGFRFGDDDADSFDPHIFIKNLPDISETVSSLWPVLLPKESQRQKSVTLVLDLDETLVHSSLEQCDGADFTFPVFFNMKEHTVYVKQRPHLHLFLERVAEMFKIVIFTASQSIYAEQLLDILDPSKRIISQRIYRESCIFSEGTYTKDLTILGLDLAKVAIIDNTPQVFRLQVNNGIPIKSWFDDPIDSALISLLPFLETLSDADDVRPLIAKKFNNEEQ